jgi:hypothetical protein
VLRALANWRSPTVTHPASTRRSPTREPFPHLQCGFDSRHRSNLESSSPTEVRDPLTSTIVTVRSLRRRLGGGVATRLAVLRIWVVQRQQTVGSPCV